MAASGATMESGHSCYLPGNAYRNSKNAMRRNSSRLWISAIVLGVLLVAWAMGEKNFPLARFVRTLLHGLM
jgi:hypothetical protein